MGYYCGDFPPNFNIENLNNFKKELYTLYYKYDMFLYHEGDRGDGMMGIMISPELHYQDMCIEMIRKAYVRD